MEMLMYLALAAALYLVVAELTDRAVEREMRRRRKPALDLRVTEARSFDANELHAARSPALDREAGRGTAGVRREMVREAAAPERSARCVDDA